MKSQAQENHSAYFEGDLVMCQDRVMSVLACVSAQAVHCVWYDAEVRATGSFAPGELQLLAPSPLRPGYRVVAPPSVVQRRFKAQ